MRSTRRQRALDLLQGREDGWSPRELAEALEQDEGTVLDDLRHVRQSLRRRGLNLEMLPARCGACGWEGRADEPRQPSRCARCKARSLMPPRFRVTEG